MIEPVELREFVDDKKLLACVHCGFCLPACPTHVLSGEEMPSPRGRLYLMRAVQEGRLEASDPAVAEHEWSCLVCRACETACPSGVEFGFLQEQTRERLREEHPPSFIERWIYTKLLSSRPLLNVLQFFTALTVKIGLSPFIRRTGRLAAESTPKLAAAFRLLPPGVEFPHSRPKVYQAEGERRGSIGLLIGCVGEAFTSRINDATVRVLTRLGYDVITFPETVCCGALGIHAGFRARSLELGRQMITAVLESKVDYFVSNIAGCGAMLKDYEQLFEHSDIAERARMFRSKTRDISEFLFELHYEELLALKLRAPYPLSVRYQAACHLYHAQRVTESPLALLNAVANVKIDPLAENELCCGSAGSYNIEHPKESEQLLDRKLRSIETASPDLVLTGNAGCLMQLQKGLRETGSKTQAMHAIEFIDRAMRNEFSGLR